MSQVGARATHEIAQDEDKDDTCESSKATPPDVVKKERLSMLTKKYLGFVVEDIFTCPKPSFLLNDSNVIANGSNGVTLPESGVISAAFV